MDSFIPWVGGKKLLRKRIIDFFPQEPPSRYIEVFGGAGWVLFGSDKHADLEVFNDIDGHLVNLYRCIKYHREELQKELLGTDLDWLPNSRELFLDYRQQIEQQGLTDIQRAARYFLIIRLSYGADRRSFGCSKKALLNAIGKFEDVQNRLRDVVIENRDFERLIKTYDRPNALFYLDPPYYSAERFYDGFTKEDHQRLRSVLERLKGKFILSYNNDVYIKDLYEGFNIHEVERANNLLREANQDNYKELIITNY